MPELPDLTIYVEALNRVVVGRRLRKLRLASPFVLRTADPPVTVLSGRMLSDVRRLGKRIVLGFEGDLHLLIHLMIAGRLNWKASGIGIPARGGLAALDFDNGSLLLTEAGTKRRASIHLVSGADSLKSFDAGGLEPLEIEFDAFLRALRRENHTLKRSLTDPRVFAGIGNAYSDEILHRARLSPTKRTSKISDADARRLFHAMQAVLSEWVERLRTEAGGGFPLRVTAFREGMAVHGRFRKPCPVCASPVQRIVFAENESNYCPACQTEGKILADRALSRLFGRDWPRTLEELERRGLAE